MSEVSGKKRPVTQWDVLQKQSGHVHSKEPNFSYQSHRISTVALERTRNIKALSEVLFLHWHDLFTFKNDVTMNTPLL
jgi:hypothetical protein